MSNRTLPKTPLQIICKIILYYPFIVKNIIGPDNNFHPTHAEAAFVPSTMMQSFLKSNSKPSHVGINWIALAEYSQMSTYVPGFHSFVRFFASFCIGQISHQQDKG